MPFTYEENIGYFDMMYAMRIIGDARQMHWIERRLVHITPRLRGSVLDLGSGLGLLADRTKEKYLGVDFSKIAIKYARENTKNPLAKFVLTDLFKFVKAAGDDSWDTVVLGEVLEHFEPDPRAALLAEAKRIAKMRVVISVPENSPNPSHVQHIWKRDQVEALIGIAEIVRTRGHYYAVWEKDGRANGLQEIADNVAKTKAELKAKGQDCPKCDEKKKAGKG